MNKVVGVLLLLSVAVTASAVAIELDQKNNEQNFELDESELQTQDEGKRIQLSNFPWGKDQRSEIADEVQIPSDDITKVASAQLGSQPSDEDYDADRVEQIRTNLWAVQQRNFDALQNAPRTTKRPTNPLQCISYANECAEQFTLSRRCTRVFFWICQSWRVVKGCSRWVRKCIRYRTRKRGNIEEIPVQSPSVERDDSQGERTASDGDKVISVEEQKTDVAKLQSESLTTFRNVYDDKVVKAEKYELLTSTSGEKVDSKDEKFFAVIVTLTDGHRYAIALGRELWKDESTAVLDADEHFADKSNNWQLVESKTIELSTVADYVRESDSSNSAREAADKMMALS